jgi:hypothetical protein
MLKRLNSRRKVQASVLIVFLAALPFAVYAFSSSVPPPGRAGDVPNQGCVDPNNGCHILPDPAPSPTVVLMGVPNSYTPGQTYELSVMVSEVAGTRGGFQLVALDALGTSAGTLINGPDTDLIDGSGPSANRVYISHKGAPNPNPSTARRDWSFQWTAPAANRGTVTFFVTGLAALDSLTDRTNDVIAAITQTSTPCSYTISPMSQSFAANGGTGSINVTAPAGCPWTAVSNNPSFITITGGSNGSGNGTVTFSVGTSTSTNIRNGTITVAGITFTVFQGAAFLDVPQAHPFYTEIGKLSARMVTLGCSAGNYCPDDVVTRQQMAAFIIRALGDFNPPQPPSQRFLDVLPSNPFYAFIEQMAIRQITLGCGGGNYCPGDPVLRDQMAAFIIRGLGEFNPPDPPFQRFPDVPPGNPFYRFIDRMAVLQITLGCGGGNYCPTLAVSRGQMAAFLVRAFNL